jgi:mRNA-degrading endonuclease toxin of MazEF toxin-antitoxin module
MVINQGDLYWIDLGEPGGSEPGEGELTKQSVVQFTQVFTVHKTQLYEYIGTLSQTHLANIGWNTFSNRAA